MRPPVAEPSTEPSAIARQGISTSGSSLPHLEQIQRSFGPHHDVSQVRAHIDGEARLASDLLGAEAYAIGDHVGFRGLPTLHTAAHEAAHVVQQRHGLFSGRGGAGHEDHADAVADRVVRGEPAGPLLDRLVGAASAHGRSSADAVVQCKKQRGQALDAKHHPAIKQWIRKRGFAEIVQMVDGLNLAIDRPQVVRTETLDGTKHQWQVSLSWSPSASSSTSAAKDDPAKPGVHVIDVEVGYKHASRDQATIPKQSPYWSLAATGVDRGLFLTAESMHHEFIHVLILIGRQLETLSPGFASHSAAFERYRNVLGVVEGPTYDALKKTIGSDLLALGSTARKELNLPVSDDVLSQWASASYEFFVHEKVAYKQSARRFSSSPSNSVIATAYVANHVKKLIDPGLASMLYRRLEATPRYATQLQTAIASVTTLFNGIDTDPLITGEFVPGLRLPGATPDRPAPVSTDGKSLTE